MLKALVRLSFEELNLRRVVVILIGVGEVFLAERGAAVPVLLVKLAFNEVFIDCGVSLGAEDVGSLIAPMVSQIGTSIWKVFLEQPHFYP